MESTKAPWATTPVRASASDRPPATIHPAHVPQASCHSDTLSPTVAPWADESTPLTQGNPVPHLIHSEPHMPDTVQPCGQFRPAHKRITSAEDLKLFLQGATVQNFMGFILALNEAVTSRKNSDITQSSEAVLTFRGLLDTLASWVDEIPPLQQPLRYGNPAFRSWHSRLLENALQLLQQLLPTNLEGAAVELVPYLVDSFGNQTRIDYGTGHETTFVGLLYCLAKLGVFTNDDKETLVTVVFRAYLALMRKIQTTYWLEPAGSHGVWGLDDYHFLPFIWGSAQLINHKMIKPKSIHNSEILHAYASEYLYLHSVEYVKQVKKGPLTETSPMLTDISSVPNWAKVNSGMIKMYQVEVLSKFPIMQHFLFGSLLPFE